MKYSYDLVIWEEMSNKYIVVSLNYKGVLLVIIFENCIFVKKSMFKYQCVWILGRFLYVINMLFLYCDKFKKYVLFGNMNQVKIVFCLLILYRKQD